MIKTIRDAVKITNDNIILAIPLIIFMWVVGAYLGYSMYTADTLPEVVIAIVTMLFMLGAFLSGWFYMIRKAVKLSGKVFVMDKDRAEATLNLFREFPAGIGKYFLSFIGMSLLFILIFSLTAAFVYKIGMATIGDFDLTPAQLDLFLKSPEDARLIVSSLNENQLIKLASWDLLLMFCSAVVSYLTFLWIPEVLNGVRNPFIALISSIKKVLTKPLKTLNLFLFICIVNFVLTLFSSFAVVNPILYFIVKILYFYFLVFIVVMLFVYYYREFIEEKSLTGSAEDEGKSEK